MAGLGYACALLLAAVFVRAGAAKLARPAQTAASFVALGVPAPAAAARVVPILELALAVALAAGPRAGGVSALVLLGAFTALLARAVRRGVAAPCNCFGAARADPVSNVDILRNALLAGLAAGALTAPLPVVPSAASAAVASALLLAGLGLLRAVTRRR